MTRIIAGAAGGRTVRTPPGSGTRPTSDRVREAVFSALDARDAVQGSRVLDLYAGSGALGLEAASRGAASVVLVESDRRAADVIAGNARDLALPGRARRAHHRRGPPRPGPRGRFGRRPRLRRPALRPRRARAAALVLDRLAAGWLAPGGLLVVERSTRSPEPPGPTPSSGPPNPRSTARPRSGTPTLTAAQRKASEHGERDAADGGADAGWAWREHRRAPASGCGWTRRHPHPRSPAEAVTTQAT